MTKKSDPESSTVEPFRPPAPLLAAARKIAALYRMTLEEIEGDWIGSSVELPNVLARGTSNSECVERTQEALTLAVAYLMHSKAAVPRPCRTQARDKQVNVRLTAQEKLFLDTAARAEGFRSASDFIRTTVFSFLGRRDGGLPNA